MCIYKTCEPFWLIWKYTVFCLFTNNIIALMSKRLENNPNTIVSYVSISLNVERSVMPFSEPKTRALPSVRS